MDFAGVFRGFINFFASSLFGFRTTAGAFKIKYFIVDMVIFSTVSSLCNLLRLHRL